MKKILAAVLAICLWVGAAHAQTQATESTEAQLTRMCVADIERQSADSKLDGLDANKYCTCMGKRLARHEGKLEHTDGENTRKQVVNDMTPCLDEHMRPPLLALCSDFNKRAKDEKQKIKVDCNCYYKNMVTMFGDIWSKNLTNQPLAEAEQKTRMESAIQTCVKETP